jgi:RNA polymerase sigma factor (sigma-70 family)
MNAARRALCPGASRQGDEMMRGAATDDRAEVFERHRARLFGIAYRMLGSVADAEDVLQSAYLRWHEADAAAVRSPEAWLVAVTTRLAVDRLRSAATERRRYVGDWLPEPIPTPAPPADRRAELASDLSMAFLVLLERLSPDERAALLLRDVFDASYEEIARALEKSETACRQTTSSRRSRTSGACGGSTTRSSGPTGSAPRGPITSSPPRAPRAPGGSWRRASRAGRTRARAGR